MVGKIKAVTLYKVYDDRGNFQYKGGLFAGDRYIDSEIITRE